MLYMPHVPRLTRDPGRAMMAGERAHFLIRIADAIEAHAEEIAQLSGA